MLVYKNNSRIMKIILVLFFVMSLAYCKLYQVVSLFRHGARYHINDLYDGNSTKALKGELTAVGMKMHENLGKIIRK
jgi:hypothetical protein